MSSIKLDDLLYETDTEDLDNFLNEENLEEGPFGNAWGAVKSLVAKGGSLEKGGKLFGRGKASKEMVAKYDAALEKAGAAALKDLDAKLKEKFPNFPNMGNKEAKAFSKEIYDELGGSKAATAMFIAGDAEIRGLYKSIVDSVEKYDPEKPEAQDSMDPNVANELINGMRIMVKRYLDNDLADAYKHFENKSSEGDLIFEGDLSDLLFEMDLAFLNEEDAIEEMTTATQSERPRQGRMQNKPRQESGEGDSVQAVAAAKELGLPPKAAQMEIEGLESGTIKGLKSNKLPIFLLALAALGGAFAWLAKQPWFLDMFRGPSGGTIVKRMAGPDQIVPGSGQVGTTYGLDILNGTPGKNISGMQVGDFMNNMQGHGLVANGQPTQNLLDLAKAGGTSPADYTAWWGEAFGSASPTATLGKTIPVSGLGGDPRGSIITPMLKKTFVKKLVAGGSAKGSAATIGGISVPALGYLAGALGIGAALSAAAVWGLRYKGRKASRAKVLNDTLQMLQFVKVPEKIDVVAGDQEIEINLFAPNMTIKLIDKETGEEDELDLDLSGYVPNLPALVEMGITAPNDILSLLSEAHAGEFIFKNRQGEPKDYPADEGTFGGSFKNFDDYPTLLRWVNALIKARHKEFGPITKDMLDGAIKDGSFTLNDKRKGGRTGPGRPPGGDPPGGPPKTPPGGKGKPRLAILRLDDDGVHVHRTRGGISDDRYETEKARFQAAQDQGITGRDTTPSSSDLDDRRKGVTHLGRNKPVRDRTYDQMVKDMGSPDLRRKGVEVEPYFTVDKSVSSDIYLKKDRKTKKTKGGSFEYPKVGSKNKAATERLVQRIFDKFVSGKSKMSRSAANKVVSNAFGDKRRKSFQDKETRDKIVDVLVAYGLVKEEIEPTDVISESVNHAKPQADERWMTLAGLGEDK